MLVLKVLIAGSGFPYGSVGKESACNVGDLGLNPGLGRFPGEGKGYPLQYSGLENSTDSIVHGVTKSQARLSDFHFTSLCLDTPRERDSVESRGLGAGVDGRGREWK